MSENDFIVDKNGILLDCPPGKDFFLCIINLHILSWPVMQMLNNIKIYQFTKITMGTFLHIYNS